MGLIKACACVLKTAAYALRRKHAAKVRIQKTGTSTSTASLSNTPLLQYRKSACGSQKAGNVEIRPRLGCTATNCCNANEK